MLTENFKIVPILSDQDLNAGATMSGDSINMANFHRATFIIGLQTLGGADPTVGVYCGATDGACTTFVPFKYAYGSTSINGSSATYVDYSSAGFTSTPVVLVTYSTTSGNWSGDNGAIKVHSKTTSGCYIVVGGNFSTSRNVDWFAFGV